MPLPSDETTPPVTTTILAIRSSPSPKGFASTPRSGARAASLQGFQLLGRIHARKRTAPGHHPDAHPALERAQLLEAFRLLRPPRRPGGEIEQEIARKRVNADVTED